MVEECRKKWKGLCDRYIRELKKVRGGKTSGAPGPVYAPQWCVFEVLSFFEDTVRHKQ